MISPLQERSAIGAGAATTIALQFTGPVTLGSSFHVVVKSSGSPTLITCADDVNGALVPIGPLVSDAGGGHRGQQFKLDSTGAGTPTVTATFSGAVTNRSIWIREIGESSGYDVQAAQNETGNVGTDGITSGLMTPSIAPGLVSVVAIIHVGAGDAISAAGTGYAPLDTHPLTGWGFIDSASEHRRYTTTAPLAGTFNVSGASSPSDMVFAACFKETGAVANTNNGTQELMGVGS